MMPNIWTLEELWGAMPDEFKTHTKEADGDLPTASFEALTQEWVDFIDAWVHGGFVWDNLAPAAHGFGLICRAVAIAKQQGHVLGPRFKDVLPY